MKNWLVFLSVVALLGVAYAAVISKGSWRYRMTVTVETPEGLKTGSAVREIVAIKVHGTKVSGSAKVSKGEAVVVDLGKRGVLFALITGGKFGPDYGHSIVFDAFRFEHGGLTPEGISHYSSLKSG